MDFRLNITNWVEVCFDAAKKAGWNDGTPNKPLEDSNYIAGQLMLIVSEASEALEDMRSKKFQTKFYDSKSKQTYDEQLYIEEVPQFKPVGFFSELADIAIRLFHLSGKLGCNLEQEIALKHEYNKTRSYRHGNKTL